MSNSEGFIDKILGPLRNKYQQGASQGSSTSATSTSSAKDSDSSDSTTSNPNDSQVQNPEISKDNTKLPDLSQPHALSDDLESIQKDAAQAVTPEPKLDVAKKAAVADPKKSQESNTNSEANFDYKGAEKSYQEGLNRLRDLISPSAVRIDFDQMFISGVYTKTLFVYDYPRFLNANWMSPVVNFDAVMNISQFIYPFNSSLILKVLQKKVVQMRSAMRMAAEAGKISDPGLETALEDAEVLRRDIQKGLEKFFQFGMYITLMDTDKDKLERQSKQLEAILGGQLILTRRASLRMEQGFNSCLPLGIDELDIAWNMNTSPLSSTFPFTSSTLTMDTGILYGLNRHNDSLVIFDRFSLENANSVVFAKSGAGKSYAVKLEILRYLMVDTDVIVIDPENEYEALCETVGGTYLKVSLNADKRINPFDLPHPIKDEILKPGDLLRSNIINLIGLLKLMLGEMTPLEEGLLDKALNDVYALKGITMDLVDPSDKEPPTMEDLQSVLEGTQGAESIVERLKKYTEGTYSGIFNKPTNIDLSSGLVVFSIRDLEDQLRPIAMYIILNYIWNRVRSSLKKRLLVIDEAWTMMQHEDSAKFLFGLVKRARKYYLGVTTITQDVEDFSKSNYGKPIITNSSMQLLLKQSPTAVDLLQDIFNLTEGEKYLLLNSGVGQGLFFAGNKHVALQVIASFTENEIVTTDPRELLKNS